MKNSGDNRGKDTRIPTELWMKREAGESDPLLHRTFNRKGRRRKAKETAENHPPTLPFSTLPHDLLLLELLSYTKEVKDNKRSFLWKGPGLIPGKGEDL